MADGLSLKSRDQEGGRSATINPNKVRADIRPKVERYQEECAIALHDYWTKGVAVRGDDEGLVTDLSDSVKTAIGGIVKGIVIKALREVVPVLVREEVLSGQYGIVKGLTAGQVLDLAGIEDRKGMRGLVGFTSRRLERAHHEKGVAIHRGHIGKLSAKVFDEATCRDWLDRGGKASILQKKREISGQLRLRLVEMTPAPAPQA